MSDIRQSQAETGSEPKPRIADSFEVEQIGSAKKLKAPGASMTIVVVGALLTGVTASTSLLFAHSPTSFEIEEVAPSDLAAAKLSLLPATAQALVDDAKACKLPLASVTLRADGSPGGIVRVRSGTYVSPPIRVVGAARVALPFPAPYDVGHGQLIVETDGAPYTAFLKPGWRTPSPGDGAVIAVHWKVQNRC